MPYNVCCFTCTILALYFGVMLKLLASPVDSDDVHSKSNSARRRIKIVIVMLVCLFFAFLYREYFMEDS